MGGIIWLAIVIYIVTRSIKKANENKQQSGSRQPQVRRQPRPNVQQPRPQQNRSNMPRQQAGRPQQKHAKQTRQTAQMTKENAILQRAKQNVNEHFDEDTTELRRRSGGDLSQVPRGEEILKDRALANHIHSEHQADHATELSNRHGVDDLDTYHLMDEVNDLIVKGYSGNLAFERDFVAEATDMLGRMYQ